MALRCLLDHATEDRIAQMSPRRPALVPHPAIERGLYPARPHRTAHHRLQTPPRCQTLRQGYDTRSGSAAIPRVSQCCKPLCRAVNTFVFDSLGRREQGMPVSALMGDEPVTYGPADLPPSIRAIGLKSWEKPRKNRGHSESIPRPRKQPRVPPPCRPKPTLRKPSSTG